MYTDENPILRGRDRLDLAPYLGGETRNKTPDETGMPLAMVYAPTQKFRDLYDKETALEKGTIFKELDLPFKGRSICKGGHT